MAFVGEKSLNSAIQSAPTLYCRDLIDHLSLPSRLALSPYSLIFCRQTDLAYDRNYNKTNILLKSMQESGYAPYSNLHIFKYFTGKSFPLNILPGELSIGPP